MHDAGGSLQLILSLALRHGDTFEVVPADLGPFCWHPR
jgi:hypothetical protein